VSGNIILKCILEKENGDGVDLIVLAQDIDQWKVLVSTVLNLLVLQIPGNSRVAS
jgi:hypothetical protein